jgi:hypothetical protein
VPRRCWICSHESTEVTCSRPVRKDRRERFKAATPVISALERQIIGTIRSECSNYAQLEAAIDSRVVARSSIIASVVSTSSYSQAKIKALPKHLQRAAYVKALYPLARETHPTTAMQWCVSAAAEMTDEQLHALIISPKELKKCLRLHAQSAKAVPPAAARSRRQESDSESIASGSEMSDYNHVGSSSSDDGGSSSDDDDGEGSAVEDGDSSEGSGNDDEDDDDGDDGSDDGSDDGDVDGDGDDGDDDDDDDDDHDDDDDDDRNEGDDDNSYE